mgnify:CR=1 FL=1
MLELINVNYEIDGKKILSNINLKIDNNKIMIITGPNGSGKSTLSKIIMGILKPTSGKILWNGKDITNMSIDKRSNFGLSYAFQQPVRFKGITVKDIIDISSHKENDINTISNILNEVGLNYSEYMNRELDDKLSGGELKRIEIASVIARKSKLIILDEPEAGIDLWSFNDLINLFVNKKKESGLLIISHQQKLFKIADEIVLLENGMIKSCENYISIKNMLCCNRCVKKENIYE